MRLKKAVGALLELMGRSQNTKRTGKWKPYMLVDAVHRHGCPCTRIGQKHGPCDCGAVAMCHEFDGILKELRKAVRE